MRILSGHQPVYLPWLGLFHKIAMADVFVVMDDVKYLKQDWNNRNYIKGSHGSVRLTVPVHLKGSASNIIKDIRIHSDGDIQGKQHWQREHYLSIRSCYAKAPYFAEHEPFLEEVYQKRKWEWLHELNFFVLKYFMSTLGLSTSLVIASEVGFEGTKSDLVLDHCKKLGADICVFGTNGKDYVQQDDFFANNISVHFQEYAHPRYPQLFGDFISHLSVLDLLMNVGPESLDVLLSGNVSKQQLLDEALDKPEPSFLYPEV